MISRRTLFGLPLALAAPVAVPSTFLKQGHRAVNPMVLANDGKLYDAATFDMLSRNPSMTATETLDAILAPPERHVTAPLRPPAKGARGS